MGRRPRSARPSASPSSTVWARPGRLSALSVLLCKSVFYGAFVWARGVRNSQNRRLSGPGSRRRRLRRLPRISIRLHAGTPPPSRMAQRVALTPSVYLHRYAVGLRLFADWHTKRRRRLRLLHRQLPHQPRLRTSNTDTQCRVHSVQLYTVCSSFNRYRCILNLAGMQASKPNQWANAINQRPHWKTSC